jgi:hypothetical protein
MGGVESLIEINQLIGEHEGLNIEDSHRYGPNNVLIFYSDALHMQIPDYSSENQINRFVPYHVDQWKSCHLSLFADKSPSVYLMEQ